MSSTKIAVMSANDGVGKTISAINLGYALANDHWRVLLVDMDPKGTMTRTLDINHNIGITELISNRLNDTLRYIDDDYIVRHSENLDCITSSKKLSIVELLLATDENLVKEALNSLPGYDFIIFDCQSGLSRINCNILEVADSLVLPTLATIESVHYLKNFITVFKKFCKKRISPRPDIEGLIINRLSNNCDLENIEHITRQIEKIVESKIDIYDAFIPLAEKDELEDNRQKGVSGRRVIASAYIDLATSIDSKPY